MDFRPKQTFYVWEKEEKKSEGIKEKQSNWTQKVDKTENWYIYLKGLYPLLIQISRMVFWAVLRWSL